MTLHARKDLVDVLLKLQKSSDLKLEITIPSTSKLSLRYDLS